MSWKHAASIVCPRSRWADLKRREPVSVKRVVQIGIACGIIIAIVGTSLWVSKRAAHQRYQALTKQGVVAQRDASGRIVQINAWPKGMPASAFELLARLSRLKVLNLSTSELTDAELRYVERIESLEELVLNQTQVTDAGVVRLASLGNLQRVGIDRPVTSVGAYRLSLARPDLKIDLRPLPFHGLNSLRERGGHGELNEKYELVMLDLHGSKVTDADLQPVAVCGQLRIVNLSGTKVGDAGLESLRDLENLREIWLTGTSITDEGLKVIAELSQLKSISLSRTGVTDAGIAHLKSLTALEVLHLGETEISDEGLQHLRGLRKLKTVYVTKSRVTTAGVTELADAIPSIDVIGGSEPEKPVEEIESRVLG